MEFDRKKLNKSQDEIVSEKANEIVNYLRRSLTKLHSLDEGTVMRLALELRKLFLDKGYGDNKKQTLFGYIYGNCEVPSVISVNEVLDNYWQGRPYTHASIPSIANKRKKLKSTVKFATSLVYAEGILKLKFRGLKLTTIEKWLSTPILILSEEDGIRLEYTIMDIISLISNKEIAHVDLDSFNKGDRLNSKKYQLLYKFSERFGIVIGIIELFLYMHACLINKRDLPITLMKCDADSHYIQWKRDKLVQPIILDKFIFMESSKDKRMMVSYTWSEEKNAHFPEPYIIFSLGGLKISIDEDRNLILSDNKGLYEILGKTQSNHSL